MNIFTLESRPFPREVGNRTGAGLYLGPLRAVFTATDSELLSRLGKLALEKRLTADRGTDLVPELFKVEGYETCIDPIPSDSGRQEWTIDTQLYLYGVLSVPPRLYDESEGELIISDRDEPPENSGLYVYGPCVYHFWAPYDEVERQWLIKQYLHSVRRNISTWNPALEPRDISHVYTLTCDPVKIHDFGRVKERHGYSLWSMAWIYYGSKEPPRDNSGSAPVPLQPIVTPVQGADALAVPS